MNNWQKFLEQRGAQWVNDEGGSGHAASFGESPADYGNLSNTLCDLGNLGILSATGPDSRKFLQGQTTCDVLDLAPGNSRPGAICNPKGRMLTSFQAYVETEEQLLLSMDKALIKPTLASIEKYAAFFKTSLTDNSDQYRLFGISGPAIKKTLLKLFSSIPTANTFVSDSAGTLLSCLNGELFIIISKADKAQAVWEQLTPDLQAVGLPWWQLQLISAGLASVSAALSEQLVPQMLNLQATGAISFSKGCYTGQEVVARMQYLGKLKRRTYRLTVTPISTANPALIPAPGTDITDTEGKLLGTIVEAAPSDIRSFAMLAVLRERALEQSELVIAGQTVAVNFNDLPYELAEQ
ncbi:MAG: hypothetical protein KUG71_08850 [Porticoccaceae bacterium]|nr:hypothetical protein [Porticoccaceae bacterium]